MTMDLDKVEVRTKALNLALTYHRQHCVTPEETMTDLEVVATGNRFYEFLIKE